MTLGHVDVVRRSTALFDEVIVAVLGNPSKTGTFSVPERVRMLRDSLEDVPRVEVVGVSQGLLVEFCRRVGAPAVVKGLRSGTDFAYELPMALMNRHLTGLETVFLPGDPRFEHISSSLVKEVARHGGPIEGLVPEAVVPRLHERIGRTP